MSENGLEKHGKLGEDLEEKNKHVNRVFVCVIYRIIM